jgi:hypothetical protein
MSDRYKLPDGRTRMKAHDVRHLRTCSACGELGDDRMMIHCMIWGVGEAYHDECAVQKLGESVLKLPLDELNKISIGAAGPDLMRKIMEKASTSVSSPMGNKP